MKRWLLMGAAVLALVLAVSLGLRSPAPVPGSGDKILTAAGEPITRDELEEARRSARALWDLGAAQSVPDDRELLARIVRAHLLEAEFEEHGITLTPEEESQAENSYADTRAEILAAIEDGSTDPDAARQTLETVQAYWEAMGWTEEEYARRAGESMAVSMKRARLIETVYAGDGAALEAELDAETEQVLAEAGYGAS